MDEEDYDTPSDRNWPIVEFRDGAWRSEWRVELAHEPREEIDLRKLERELSADLTRVVAETTRCLGERFLVRLALEGSRLLLEVATSSHTIGSENVKAIDLLFQLIVSRIAPITLIQSEPRKTWMPLYGNA